MADTGEISLFEAIYTQRAVRSLKSDPVPRELIERVVEAATKAPSGGNSQPWAFIVVDDRARLATFASWVRDGFGPMYEAILARQRPGDPTPMPRYKALIERFEDVPVVVLVAAVVPSGQSVAVVQGSVFPAVQNLLLAARGLGLGATLTGAHALAGADRLRTLLGLPDNVKPVACIPLGYPDNEGTDPRHAVR
jgi:nitroreductase